MGAEARVLARILEELDLWLLLQPAFGFTSLARWSLGFVGMSICPVVTQ